MDVAVKVAKDIITKFFKKVPKVKQLLDKFGNLAKQHGRIRTAAPFRRIRWFPEWEFAVETKDFKTMGEIERAGKNTPIQGTNGDIIKLALSMLQNKIDVEDLPVQILLSVYDEIQCECPDDIAEEWKEVMNDTMIKAAQVVIKDVPIVVDCKISKCWKK
jgi:DNA polymerase-1